MTDEQSTEKNYVVMMRESLERKLSLLKQIKVKNREQGEILQDENSLPEEFEQNVADKEIIINQIITLDDGFESVYNKIKHSLENNREAYKAEIRQMQMLISEITDLSAAVQAQEQRNKKLAEERFASVRGKVKEIRQSQMMVNTYYKNMMDRAVIDPRFMDQKK